MIMTEEIHQWSKKDPSRVILVDQNDHSWTARELSNSIESTKAQLLKEGMGPGVRTLLMVRPSFDFYVFVFALIEIRAVLIFIDPGMGKKNVLNCLKQVKAQAFIGDILGQILRLYFSDHFSGLKWIWSVNKGSYQCRDSQLQIKETSPEIAAILFTSGGTGAPKGVMTTLEVLEAQRELLKKTFHLTSKDIDFPCFAFFSIFSLSMGMKVVLPIMNFSRPAKASGQKLYQRIDKFRPTFLSGSPIVWENLSQWCLANDKKLDSVRILTMFGAPASWNLLNDLTKIIKGKIATPYGATEGLPVANIYARDVLKLVENNKDRGTCIGEVLQDVRVIKIKNGEMSESDMVDCKPMEVGEIVVSGPAMTPGYFQKEEATRLAKIYGSKIWHRMGDVGYFDHNQKLWFGGRKVYLIEHKKSSYPSIFSEFYMNEYPGVRKTALVGDENSLSVVIEPNKNLNFLQKRKLLKNFKIWAKKQVVTQSIQRFYLKKSLPVDTRHNIKIDRHALKSWIQNRSEM